MLVKSVADDENSMANYQTDSLTDLPRAGAPPCFEGEGSRGRKESKSDTSGSLEVGPPNPSGADGVTVVSTGATDEEHAIVRKKRGATFPAN